MTFVEGSGGICVPIDDRHLISDFIKMLDIPIIVVARSDLGTINHTILTVEYAKKMGLNILGVIVNKYPLKTNDLSIIHLKEELEKHCNTKLLGIIPEINIKK
ncbi:MAG: dethiobiotin synthase [Candidatus Melainabacteria bacterium]|nr:MAG: dethiobiotin synthase [Candidatus Melainabacteria bacterium]